MEPFSVSLLTNEFAPIIDLSASFTPLQIVTLAPVQQSSPIKTGLCKKPVLEYFH